MPKKRFSVYIAPEIVSTSRKPASEDISEARAFLHRCYMYRIVWFIRQGDLSRFEVITTI
jgi:hypothetical protein